MQWLHDEMLKTISTRVPDVQYDYIKVVTETSQLTSSFSPEKRALSVPISASNTNYLVLKFFLYQVLRINEIFIYLHERVRNGSK